MHLVTIEVERLVQAFEELVGDQARILAVAQFRQHDGKFIAALARQRVAAAQAVLQAQRHLLQQLVALDVAERVVDQLEAVQVDEHHGQFRQLAARLDHGQAQAVLEQHAVRQVRQDVVVGLVRDDFLGALAVGDVARYAVGAEILLLPGLVIEAVHADRIERNRHQRIAEGTVAAAAAMALQAQFHIARGALVDAALIEGVARPFLVFIVHEDRVMTADQLFAAKAQQLVHAVVDEGDAPFVVQGIDDVGRAVDQVAVHLLRVFQLQRDALVLQRQLALLQRVLHRLEQLLAAVRLAQVVVGAAFQGADGGLDADIAAHDDDVALDAAPVDVVHDFMAAHVGQAQVEQDQVEAQFRQLRQRLAAAGGRVQLVAAVLQQFVQGGEQPWFIVDQQDARAIFQVKRNGGGIHGRYEDRAVLPSAGTAAELAAPDCGAGTGSRISNAVPALLLRQPITPCRRVTRSCTMDRPRP
ncbi:hypothetical protein D3C81_399610 [compost metagenome]